MDKLRECMESFRLLTLLEKLQLLIAVLWFCVGLLILCSPKIHKVTYAILWILFLFTYTDKMFGNHRHRIQYRIALSRWSDSAVRSYRYARENEGLTATLNSIKIEICRLPKVASATGQIYVDYDEVMRILEGGDIIER